MTADTK